ncbi:MAG: DUF512 domain-containing protein, partial [Clostridia bacterium]|nr:DUF512 domain-containing protein [Clostridia bacterium]
SLYEEVDEALELLDSAKRKAQRTKKSSQSVLIKNIKDLSDGEEDTESIKGSLSTCTCNLPSSTGSLASSNLSLAPPNEAQLSGKENPPIKVYSIATGVSVYPYMRELAERIGERLSDIKIHVYPVVNEFFGRNVTVTGLLTGSDLLRELKGKELGECLLLSRNMFKAGTQMLLDDLTTDDLSQELNVRIEIVDNSGQALIDALVQS